MNICQLPHIYELIFFSLCAIWNSLRVTNFSEYSDSIKITVNISLLAQTNSSLSHIVQSTFNIDDILYTFLTNCLNLLYSSYFHLLNFSTVMENPLQLKTT